MRINAFVMQYTICWTIWTLVWHNKLSPYFTQNNIFFHKQTMCKWSITFLHGKSKSTQACKVNRFECASPLTLNTKKILQGYSIKFIKYILPCLSEDMRPSHKKINLHEHEHETLIQFQFNLYSAFTICIASELLSRKNKSRKTT